MMESTIGENKNNEHVDMKAFGFADMIRQEIK